MGKGDDRGKKRKAEDEAPPPVPLTKTRTMQATTEAAKDFLKTVGHESFSPLAKTAGRPETRSQHQMRSAVETMLSNTPRKSTAGATAEEEAERFRMVFRLIDTKKAGFVDQEQLVGAMRSLGKRPRAEKIDEITAEMDTDKNGKFTMEAFVNFMMAKKNLKLFDEAPKRPGVPASPSAEKEKKDKGKEKDDEDQPAAPPGLSVLNRHSSILDYYTENAGMHEVPVDGYEGPERDLGKNNAFASFSILLMNFNREAPLSGLFALAHQALHLKGFSVVEVNTEEELADYASSFDEIWIASSASEDKTPISQKALDELKKAHRAGKGIGIWAGGFPYTTQANVILKALTSTAGLELDESHEGKGTMKLVGLGDHADKASTLARSLLTTGLTEICEGVAYSRLKSQPGGAQVVACSHQNHPTMLAWEGSSQAGRVFLCTSLISQAKAEEQMANERRLLSNIGVWLLGLEERMKLGLRLVGDIQGDVSVSWEYFLDRPLDGKKPGWHPYDEQACKVVEAAYQKYVNSDQSDNNIRAYITVHSGSFSYEVDFKKMVQKNIAHENHTVRQIRRVGDE